MAGPLRTLAGQMIAFVTHCRYRAGRVGTSAEAASPTGSPLRLPKPPRVQRIGSWVSSIRIWRTSRLRWLPGIALTRAGDGDAPAAVGPDGWESVIALHAGVWDLPPNASVSKPEALKMLIEELPGRRLWSPQGAPSRAA